MFNFSSKFKNSKAVLKFVFIVFFNLGLITALWFGFGFFGFTLGLAVSLVLLTAYARSRNTTIPLLGGFIRQQYYNTRFKILNIIGRHDHKFSSKVKLVLLKKYQKILFYFILICKNSEDGYHVVKEDIFDDKHLLSLTRSVERKELTIALAIVDRIKDGEEVELGALEKLDALLLRLYKQRQKKVARLSASGVALLVMVSVISSLATTFFSPQINQMYAATYGWVQNDWSGGADESALATHESSQTGWTKYFSKTDNIGVEDGKLTQLTASSDVWIENSDGAYVDHGTMNGVYALNNRIYPQKAIGANCTSNGECLADICTDGVCSYWVRTICGVDVYHVDLGSDYKWRSLNGYCDTPQCGQNGGQYNDNLVADNSVDFSEYPARDACKDLGGRLPTVDELTCVMENRLVYGFYFGLSTSYWSSTEDSNFNYANRAIVGFGGVFSSTTYKESLSKVRCVVNQ